MDDATRKIVLLFGELWRDWCGGGMPDGFDFQDMLAKAGITRAEAFDPVKHASIEGDFEDGDMVHFLQPEIRDLLAKAKKVG